MRIHPAPTPGTRPETIRIEGKGAASQILVWDWPVRIGHGLMVLGFALAWLTAESENFRRVHALAGGVVLAVAAFRLLWGIFGSRYARFAQFLRGPADVIAYLASLADSRPQPQVGHNPAGGWAIVGLLALALGVGGTGLLAFNDLAGHWLEELHEGLAIGFLTLVGAHLAGVLASSRRHRENLVRAMLTGRKEGAAAAAIADARPLAALLLVVWVGVAAWLIAA